MIRIAVLLLLTIPALADEIIGTPEIIDGDSLRINDIEIRLHGIDPDTAEAKAHELGYTVLSGAVDKPHGLREVYLLDGDGYCWVPDVPL